MTRRTVIALLFTGFIAAALVPAVRADDKDDERAALQDRFKQRYPTLVKLIRSGKVGETYEALADTVKTEYASDKVDPDDQNSQTIGQFLGAENKDRRRLYEMLAEELNTTAEKVASREAKRRFDKAKPDDYLKLKSGRWVQKKDLKDDES